MPTQALNADGLGFKGLNRAFTGTTLQDPNMNVSPESTPSMSDEDPSEYATARPYNPSYREKMGSSTKRQSSAPTSDRDLRALPPSPRKSDDYANDIAKSLRSRKPQPIAGEPMATIDGIPSADKKHNVAEVIADAMKELSKIRQREQSLRPLRVVRQDPEKRPDNMLSERFQKCADDELKIRKLNAKDWLRVATWWLLKVYASSLISRFSFSDQ